MAARITMVGYDSEWPRTFTAIARRVAEALGGRMVRLEHVGSTAVPGLEAKPIIDVLLVVADSSDEAAYVPALEAAGFALKFREPGWYEHRLFNGPDVPLNLHVFSNGCPEVDRMIRFRDRLRENPDDRSVYGEAKRLLAAREWQSVDEYARAKTDVVAEILRRAGPSMDS